MKTKLTWIGKLLTIWLVVAPAVLFADDGKISGLAFGDLYYMPKHNNAAMDKLYGFGFRRIYFTYDKGIAETVTTRFRLEMNNNDPTTTPADTMEPYVKDAYLKMKPYVKDAYLKWKLGDHNLFVGMSPSPAYNREENHWGLRFIEKTPLDLWGFAPARDIGVALEGKCLDGAVLYHAMFGNGSGTAHETNKGKRVYLSIAVPFGPFVVEGYVDHTLPGQHTFKGFFGYSDESLRAGALYSTRYSTANTTVDLASGYVAGKIGESLWAFGRADKMLDAAADSLIYIRQNTANKPTLVLAGLDYEAVKDFHVAPNLETVFYSPSIGVTDYFARVTFSYSF